MGVCVILRVAEGQLRIDLQRSGYPCPVPARVSFAALFCWGWVGRRGGRRHSRSIRRSSAGGSGSIRTKTSEGIGRRCRQRDATRRKNRRTQPVDSGAGTVRTRRKRILIGGKAGNKTATAGALRE